VGFLLIKGRRVSSNRRGQVVRVGAKVLEGNKLGFLLTVSSDKSLTLGRIHWVWLEDDELRLQDCPGQPGEEHLYWNC
jgi:hypothetical protein